MRSTERVIWSGMRQRCCNPNNPSYKHYGGRGITICDRWLESFYNFLSDMGPRPSKLHSIDRIDNDGPYSPDNCRWATQAEQSANSRHAVYLTAFGRTQRLYEWAKELKVHNASIQYFMEGKYSDQGDGRTLEDYIGYRNSKRLTAFGETRNLTEWAEHLGVLYTSIIRFMARGRTLEQYIDYLKSRGRMA